MKTLTFDALITAEVGDSLADMHRALGPQLDEKMAVVPEHIAVGVRVSDQLIERAMQGKGRSYLNKMLVLVDIDDNTGRRTCAYSYDGVRGGIVTFF